MKKLSARSAGILMAALTGLFCLSVLISTLGFMPRAGVRVAAASAAETQELFTGRNENEIALELLPGERINLNTAVAAELKKLPGIGDGLAAAILEYREVHGPFTDAEQLLEVPGIGEKRFAAIRDLVTTG